DEAAGVMAKNESGQLAMTKVTLRPKIEFSGENRPTADEVDALHHKSHDACFIANSVKTEVVVEQ
ncbi:MAG: OsmC family protein, partial [Altererythrobacter ishigakiensis]|nr:OsmC family protein [Altererythrobacter ishigakiensis]